MSRFVRVTRGAPGVLDSNGLERLRMALWEDGREVDHVEVVSGAAGVQNFRTLANEVRGRLEPCPEGVYRNIGSLDWGGNPGDYSRAAYISDALGPVVIVIYGERQILIHLDANRAWSPGSAGCVCPLTLEGLKKVVNWWLAGVPEWVECDWGLGTVTKPGQHPAKLRRIALDAHDGKVQARENGKVLEALLVRIDHHTGKIGLAVNGDQMSAKKIRSISLQIVMEE